MADAIKFEVVTPTGIILSVDVEDVYAPGQLGEFGVLEGHTDLICNLISGVVRYKTGGAVKNIAVGGGYAEVAPGKVNLLVDTAFMGEDINASEVDAELAAAEKAIDGVSEDDPDYAANKAIADFAKIKLAAAGGGKVQ
ncbi:hypothetical protein MNBD_DELTA01-184 [hydrothermal vent metagenome]|uniref:ATP synthase F1 complex delta/epsilon subunit N-terminal domain-containing protein n=1 Tax=hydrothermal vent metagenome TaxID=652676 RepID=A0A3B0RFV6_9ZZZZ